jgi:hypothetical protein
VTDDRDLEHPRTTRVPLTDDERDAVTDSIRSKAAEAAERFRAMDPRRHGIRLPAAATAKSYEQRWEEARARAREMKAQMDADLLEQEAALEGDEDDAA